MTNTKMTKTQMFEETISALRMLEGTEDLIAFHEKQIAQLEAKAAKAKETAAKKRAENDKLCDAVEAALTDEATVIDEIVERVEFEGDVTRSKVVNRLTKLVKEGRAVKSEIAVKGEDGKSKKVSAYALASCDAE